jgi:hypothetical protein
MSIKSSLLTVANSMYTQLPWWKCVLTTGREISERGMTFDMSRGGLRPIDWSLDLCSGANPDILKVKEIWLMFPSELTQVTYIEKGNPIHQVKHDKFSSAVLPVKERGCVFQMKIKTLDGFGANTSTFECQIVGTVGDKVSGECHCYIWDAKLGLVAYKTSIYDFGSWREEIAPLSNISHAVVGLNLA